MNVLDTNIYVYSHDVRDPRKRDIALQLIRSARPLILPWQVGCEFVAACRKLEAHGFSHDDAWDALKDIQGFVDRIVLPDVTLWSGARELEERHALSFWDALLVAASIAAGAKTIYSEDLAVPSRLIPGLTLINPFA